MFSLKKKKKLLHSFLVKETSPAEISQDHVQVELESIKNSFKAVSGDLLEASPSPVAESSWKWWSCCCCTSKFPDSDSHCKHVLDHLQPLHEDAMVFLWGIDEDFPEEWAKKLSDSRWTPINVARDALVNQICYSPTVADWDVSLMSTDAERTELLDSISAYLKIFLEKKILHISHLCTILDYAMEAVEGRRSWELLKMMGVDKNSALCIRFLGSPQLEFVRDFLRDIELCTKENNSSDDDDDDDTVLAPLDNNNMRVVLDPSRSSILIYVDQWFRQTDDGNGNASWKVNAEAVISWLYSGAPAEEALISWVDSKVLRNKLGKRILKKYETEIKISNILYEQRDHWMKYEDALLKIESKCKERTEGKRGIKSFKAILEGWRESLVDQEEEKVCINAITEVLKEAEDRNDDNQNDIIMKALEMAKDKSIMKLHLNTAEVMQNIEVCRRLKKRLATVSCFDYLTIVIPLAKCFLREKWESDAISEDLLKECKQTQEKGKSKLSKGEKETRRRR